MIISVVSGKGGAGKTTVATSLAHILSADYYDLDVDAPNGEYFLQPDFCDTHIVSTRQPKIDTTVCAGCAACTRECRFNALYKLLDKVYLNESLCHSCNLCREVCPSGAISYRATPIGEIRSGFSARSNAKVHIGDLAIGSTRATALIQHIVQRIDPQKTTIIDGPPGNSCAAVAAIKPADLVVVVVEPTPFGLHDMRQTLEILEKMQKQLLILANKSQEDLPLTKILAQRGQRLAASIPLKAEYRNILLRGEILSQTAGQVRQTLQQALASQGLFA